LEVLITFVRLFSAISTFWNNVGKVSKRLRSLRAKMRNEVIRLLQPKGSDQLPTNEPFSGLFGPDENGADPTPAIIALRVRHLRDSLLFLHDPNCGGEVSTEESESRRSS
jgi:hypothetical protein